MTVWARLAEVRGRVSELAYRPSLRVWVVLCIACYVPTYAAFEYAYLGAGRLVLGGAIGAFAAVGALTWWQNRRVTALDRAEARLQHSAARASTAGMYFRAGCALLCASAPLFAVARHGMWWVATVPSCWCFAAMLLPMTARPIDASSARDGRIATKTR